ncbi:MAG: alpha/beta fold hydrolase [Deltaproteobacteria bacterium]|nr:alpha/beta fold hydrolase [Deltaproteobacteria bacterium]
MDWRELWEVRNRARALAAPGLDATPKAEVHREGKWSVRVVLADDGTPAAPAVARGAPLPPVLLVPPLMVRPLVFDLQPDHSFVRLLRDRGLATYVLDLGEPDRGDRAVRLDDYVLQALPAAADAVRAHAGATRLSLVGYCLGGLFGLLHAAGHPGQVARLATVATPVDFSKMGFVGLLGAAAAGRVDPLVDALGVVPGWLATAGFQLLSGRRAVERVLELRDHGADEPFLRAYGSISSWLGGLVPYPGEAFKQFLRELMRRNRAHDSWLTFGERRFDLAAVDCPVLAFAGESDAIAPLASVVALREHLPPERVVVRPAPGGHVGVLGGPAAPAAVWEPTAEFLRSS